MGLRVQNKQRMMEQRQDELGGARTTQNGALCTGQDRMDNTEWRILHRIQRGQTRGDATCSCIESKARGHLKGLIVEEADEVLFNLLALCRQAHAQRRHAQRSR